MPETMFRISWPDDTSESCYSPSSIIARYLEPKAYTVGEFVIASRLGFQAASERVQEVYGGYGCSRAMGQLMAIEAKANNYDKAAMMRVESIGSRLRRSA